MKNHLMLLLAIAIFASTMGCVPVQLSRITLAEKFSQDFNFGNASPEELTGAFEILLGKDKWLKLSDSDEWRDKQHSRSLSAEGIVTLVFSLVPAPKPTHFFVSGIGSYYVIDRDEDQREQVYLSAQFNIIDSIHYPIEVLETANSLPVYFDQILVNRFQLGPPGEQFETFAFRPDSLIRVDVRLTRVPGKEHLVGIDYAEVNHVVSIGGKPLGSMKFKAPKSRYDKIIDLKGIKNMIRRYKKLY